MAIKIEGAKKKVKVVTRDPIFLDEKAVGTEPTWDNARALEFSDEEFDHYFRKSMRYYNYFYTTKDLKKYFVEWLRGHQGKDSQHHHINKETIDYYAKTKDTLTPFTACAIVKAHTQGMPLRDRHVEYLLATVKKVIALQEAQVGDDDIPAIKSASKTSVKAPTIQDRMNEIAMKHRLYFEELEDKLFEGKTVEPKAYEYLLAKNVPQAMLGKIVTFFENHRNEIVEARTTKDEDLKDAYSHFKNADYKRCDVFYTALFNGITQYGHVKKATKKANVRKPPAKEKLVAKLKYLKTDPATKAVSINPVDIIGAQVLFVYNIHTRKLGEYVAEDMGGALNVKGTTITGYSESKSVQKTLRKPEVQLKEFLSAGKVELRKFIKNIKTTEIKLNGRINTDTILLKVQ